MKKINIAIVGATGMVGNMFIKILEEKNFNVNNIYFFASKKSAGKQIKFKNNNYTVQELTETCVNDNPQKIDIALFSAGGSISKKFAPIFRDNGIIVIDNSSAWRMDDNTPLVVPEVNPEDIKKHKGIIANPNCSTIQAMVALKPLDDKFKIKRVVYSTYQAVSGAGVQGYNDLKNGAKGESPQKFNAPIFGNCIPQIDVFDESGYTLEELKMINETRKILHNDNLAVTATTVRVPVFNGHAESINIEFDNSFDIKDIFDTLQNAKGIIVKDDIDNELYPMQIDLKDNDEVFVGRIRRDFSVDNGINIWVVADNIRKGAASNAVQIAEYVAQNIL